MIGNFLITACFYVLLVIGGCLEFFILINALYAIGHGKKRFGFGLLVIIVLIAIGAYLMVHSSYGNLIL